MDIFHHIGQAITQFSSTLAAAGNGTAFIFDKPSILTVSLKVASGSGKVQASASTVAEIEAGNGTWHDWTPGATTVDAADAAQAITAIRQVNVSGSQTLEVVVNP